MTPQQRLYAYYGGSKKTAAAALKVTDETIRLWLKKGIPVTRAVFVEKKTQGFVTADEIFRHARKVGLLV
jgi:hypothetical protein